MENLPSNNFTLIEMSIISIFPTSFLLNKFQTVTTEKKNREEKTFSSKKKEKSNGNAH